MILDEELGVKGQDVWGEDDDGINTESPLQNTEERGKAKEAKEDTEEGVIDRRNDLDLLHQTHGRDGRNWLRGDGSRRLVYHRHETQSQQ